MIRFTHESTNAVFAANDYTGFKNLMFDAASGVGTVSKEEANDKIREVFRQILGVDENCSRKELRKAIRKHKVDVFEVIEETVSNLLVSGWGENPFFNDFVETKSMAIGDTNEFYVPYECILTVSEVSGNHHNLIRQKLTEGETFHVKTGWYGIKIYAEYELFMAGKLDWAGFVQKIYEAFDKKINDMVYEAVMAVGDKIVPTAQFVKTGALDAAMYDTFITLIEDVQMATGEEVVIMGTKSALAKLNGMREIDWVSDAMRQERYTTGRLGLFEGVRLVEIPQAFANNDTSKKLVDATKLLVMPVGDNKFIKLYDEGDAQMSEVNDKDTNRDMSIEAEYQQKMGVATIVGKKFGIWNIA